MSNEAKIKARWIALLVAIAGIVPLASFSYGIGKTVFSVNQSPERLDRLEAWQTGVKEELAVLRSTHAEILASMKRQEEILKIIRDYGKIINDNLKQPN